jgi:hypothetical protein
MPLAKIHVLEGRYTEARLGKVSNAIQRSLMSALGLFTSCLRGTRSFLGLRYSDDLLPASLRMVW